MDQTVNYRRTIARVLFIVLLLAVMSAPQLLSESPGPGFAQIRTLIAVVPLKVWLVIGAGALLSLGIMSTIRGIQSRGRMPKIGSSTIRQMSIQEAVSIKNKGNGLVSDAFPLELPWLGIAGWVEVQTPGMECLTIDGKYVVQDTRLHFAPMRLLGKPSSARRVLLSPARQVIPTVEALGKDKWSAKIDATIILRVRDPLSVMSEKPLDDLNHLAQGVIGEHIRSHTQKDLLSDTGPLRRALEEQLRQSRALQGLEIVEVPIQVAGDERVIETRRQEAIQQAMHDLVEMQGENQLTEAGFNLRIQQLEAQLRDWESEQEHARDMQRRRLEAQVQTLQGTIGAIATIAASGIDPTGAIGEIKKLIGPADSMDVGDASQDERGVPQPELLTESTIAKERRMLEEKQTELGITGIKIEPSSSEPKNPGSARIAFPEYALLIECPDDYPESAPSIIVQPGEGEEFEIAVPWQPGNHLTAVVVSALMQVPFELEKRAELED